MSRTTRALPSADHYFRVPAHIATQRLEIAAQEELQEEEAGIPNRLRVRSNPKSGAIPTAWDDLVCSAYVQMKYLWKKV